MNEFINQHSDTVNECSCKNAPGRFIPVSIDVYRKYYGISKKGNTADSCQQLFIRMKNVEIF